MKIKITITILIMLFISFTEVMGQHYYWSNNQKIPLVEDRETYVVSTGEGSDTEIRLTKANFVNKLERINHRSILVKLKSSEDTVLDGVLTPIKQEYYSRFQRLIKRYIFSLKLGVGPGSIFPLV